MTMKPRDDNSAAQADRLSKPAARHVPGKKILMVLSPIPGLYRVQPGGRAAPPCCTAVSIVVSLLVACLFETGSVREEENKKIPGSIREDICFISVEFGILARPILGGGLGR